MSKSHVCLSVVVGVLLASQSGFCGEDKIVFCSQRNGPGEIFVMNPDGTGQTNLTNNSREDLDPCLSPDGTRIAFESWPSTNGGEIFVMNADGTGETNLTNNSSDDYDPYFSPDGKKIVFTSNRDGDWEIYLMNADGSGQTNLTRSPTTEDRVPAFAPDGSNIVYASDNNICLIKTDGSDKRQITTNGWDYYPSFSPDGQYIIFTSWRDMNGEIYRMRKDGTDQTNLTGNAAQDMFPASVSPDGTRIAFTSDRDGNDEIYTMGFDGSSPTRLTFNAEMDRQPSWGPAAGPPTVLIWTAVEIGWKSVAGRNYQVQWTTNLLTGVWSNHNGLVTGDGSTNSVFDSIRGVTARFYRVLELQ